MPREVVPQLEKFLNRITDRVRRVLFRTDFMWRVRNSLARTAIVEMESPLEGFRMRLPLRYLRLYGRGGQSVHEPQVPAFIGRVVQEGWVTADIGAFAGYYTLLLSKLVGSTGQVHSFEPVPENFELLDSNVKLNRCGNVTENQLAVGARDDETKFTRLRGLYMSCGTLLSKSDRSRYEEISVRVRSLDSYLVSRGWPFLHFAKIDVEAAEARVVEGMYETLRRFSPILLIEIHDRLPHDRVEARKTLPLLFDIGYSVYSLEDDPELKFPLRTPEAWSGEKHCVATRTLPG